MGNNRTVRREERMMDSNSVIEVQGLRKTYGDVRSV